MWYVCKTLQDYSFVKSQSWFRGLLVLKISQFFLYLISRSFHAPTCDELSLIIDTDNRTPVLTNVIRSSPSSADFSISPQTGVSYEVSYYINIGNSFDRVHNYYTHRSFC